MGFFSKLKKVVSGIDKGAVIAQTASGVLPGKAGKIAGDVATGTGVVTTIVQQLQAASQSSPPEATPEDGQQKATLVTAVAVDDHEQRILALEQEIQQLKAGGVQSPPQS